jgi:hypothetical protein
MGAEKLVMLQILGKEAVILVEYGGSMFMNYG